MRRLTAGVLLASVGACASPGMPPGGPPDVAAPQIVGIAPDSGRTSVTPREVIFRFDEVVSERPPSVPTLADLFMISPKDGTPRVSWNRDEIAVRPRGAWRRNTAYTVTMLGGLSDIRGNVRNSGASTFFSTGPLLARTRIAGRVFDWVSGIVAAGALVESFVPPDSTHAYLAITDSSGAFALEHLPAGRYLVRGVVDRNRNRGIDAAEPWDSVSVTLTDSSVVELLVFTRDSVPPRIREVTGVDSISLRVVLDRPVDPTQRLSAANFAVIGSDSVAVGILSVSSPVGDTARAGDTAVVPRPTRPPLVARRDTAARAPLRMSRPRPIAVVVITLARPLTPGQYRVRSIGLPGLLGVTGDSERTYTVPVAVVPARVDSAPRPTSPAAPKR